MAPTRDFKETIRARVKARSGFRKALLREGIENFLSGDVETGKIILRDFINATVGFTKLSDVRGLAPGRRRTRFVRHDHTREAE